MPFPVKDDVAVQTAADSIASNRITPVFTISSVTGQGVDLLRSFVAKVRRSIQRYAGIDNDPEVCYERMPSVHFPIDGKLPVHLFWNELERNDYILIVDTSIRCDSVSTNSK